ncbi:MAG TPA: NAD-dependent epimerase/dehydratase family protein [Actinomycetota bacterium]|nr:NAD-dependent epimerase/dehydratase family protein [Actinomycetota bacterium]
MKLVTGGAGFIGSAVVRALLARGEEVRVVDDLSKGASSIPEGVEPVAGDIADPQICARAFQDVDVCFHLAAKIGGIGYFHRYPADILDDNNGMLSRVFRTATERGTKVVYVSSSMVFERATEFPTPEEALDRSPPPFSAYGFSKLVGEWYCRAFHEQFETPFAIARPFNAYGPGEHAEREPGLAHVIPDLMEKISSGRRPIPIFGDGSQSRSFTYVDDVADAIVTIGLDPRAEGRDFNIGTGVETSVRELLDLLWRIMGEAGEPDVAPGDTLPVDVKRRAPDVTRIRSVLGWQARVGLEDGLRRTAEWHQEVRRTSSSRLVGSGDAP